LNGLGHLQMPAKPRSADTASAKRSLGLGERDSRNRKSFTSGLLTGLSAASLFLTGGLPRLTAPREGIASDWRAVGSDLNDAVRKRGR